MTHAYHELVCSLVVHRVGKRRYVARMIWPGGEYVSPEDEPFRTRRALLEQCGRVLAESDCSEE